MLQAMESQRVGYDLVTDHHHQQTISLFFMSVTLFLLICEISPPKKERKKKRVDFPGGSDGKESACNSGDLVSIPESGICLGEGNGHPLLYSCLENPMDRGAWQATIHGVAKIRT